MDPDLPTRAEASPSEDIHESGHDGPVMSKAAETTAQEGDADTGLATRGIANRTVQIGVAAYCLAYFVQGGLENGVGPCLITTMQEAFQEDTSTVVLAQNAAEVAKIIGSVGVGYLAQTEHRILFTVVGTVLWSIGTIVVGISTNIYLVGLGFFIFGIGYSATTVIVAPVFNQITPGTGKDQKQTRYLGISYAAGGLGVAAGFVVCGLTVGVWRANFFLWPLGLIPVFFLLLTVYHGIKHTFTGQAATTANGGDGVSKEAKGLGVKGFFNTLKASQSEHPPLWPTVRTILGNKATRGAVIIQIFTGFYINAFTQLTPKFVEEAILTNEEHAKEHASYVMAATVPCVCAGMILGGLFCDKFKLPLHKMLLFCAIASGATIPLMFLWLTRSLVFFVIGLICTMLIAFLGASPQVTAMAVSATLQDKLSAHDPDRVPVEAVIAVSNGLAAFVSRILGSITGPLTLSYLIDHRDDKGWLTFSMCYIIVGLIGSIGCTCGGVYGWYHARKMQIQLDLLHKHGSSGATLMSGAVTPVAGSTE